MLPSSAATQKGSFQDAVHATVIHRRRLSVQTTMSKSQSDDKSIWYEALDFPADGEEVVLANDLVDEPLSLTDEESAPFVDHRSSVTRKESLRVPSRITRRLRLPEPASGDEGSLFVAFKKNIGKVRYTHSQVPRFGILFAPGLVEYQLPSGFQ